MDSTIQTLIAVAVFLSTVVLSIKTYYRKDWGMVGALIPRFYLLSVLIADLFTNFTIPSVYFHLGILIVLLGDFISNLFILLNPRFHIEIYSLHLLEILNNLKIKYDFLVENASVGIYVLDQYGNFEFVNTYFAKTLGYRREELLGHSIYTVIPIEGREQIKKNLYERVNGISDTASYSTNLLTKDERIIKVHINAKKTENGHTTITGCITKL